MTLTIQAAIDTLLATVPGAPFPDTVDTVKLGDPSQPLRRIAVTFLASLDILERAGRLGANLLITHEPTFYNHLDETDWLGDNPVAAAKRRAAAAAGLVVWRFHDTLHALTPDPTEAGLAHDLGWETYRLPGPGRAACRLPAPRTLRQVAQHVQDHLGVAHVRVVGRLDQPVQTIGLVPGSPNVREQLGMLGRPEVDVSITGEISEWETSEFARDAAHLGLGKGLIVTGHAASEEPGMRWLIPWIKQHLPGVPVEFIATTSAFQQL